MEQTKAIDTSKSPGAALRSFSETLSDGDSDSGSETRSLIPFR